MSNFEISLREIQRRLRADDRLSHYRTIWCQGCNSSRVSLVITLFTAPGVYTQKFIPFKNFANYKADSDNQTAFDNQYNTVIGQLI